MFWQNFRQHHSLSIFSEQLESLFLMSIYFRNFLRIPTIPVLPLPSTIIKVWISLFLYPLILHLWRICDPWSLSTIFKYEQHSLRFYSWTYCYIVLVFMFWYWVLSYSVQSFSLIHFILMKSYLIEIFFVQCHVDRFGYRWECKVKKQLLLRTT